MNDIKPTRSELFQLRKKIALAKSGHSLLKKKRDGLIVEFFKLLNDGKKMFGEIDGVHKDAKTKLVLAEMTEGSTKLRATALSTSAFPAVDMRKENLMGVSICRMGVPHDDDSGPGTLGVNIRIEEAIESYRGLLRKFVKYAEINFSIYRMLEEIEKTKRKVNALEFKIIPELEKAEKFIVQRLEEMERENVFRLKRMKGAG